MTMKSETRRSFLASLAGPLVALAHPRALLALPPHPDPRPGVDGSRVLPATRVMPHVAELFDGVREIPGVVDGLACRCGCAAVPGMYSLLSCYEEAGMAQYCDVCQGEGRLAVTLHAQGHTLDEIRAAVDRRFG